MARRASCSRIAPARRYGRSRHSNRLQAFSGWGNSLTAARSAMARPALQFGCGEARRAAASKAGGIPASRRPVLRPESWQLRQSSEPGSGLGACAPAWPPARPQPSRPALSASPVSRQAAPNHVARAVWHLRSVEGGTNSLESKILSHPKYVVVFLVKLWKLLGGPHIVGGPCLGYTRSGRTRMRQFCLVLAEMQIAKRSRQRASSTSRPVQGAQDGQGSAEKVAGTTSMPMPPDAGCTSRAGAAGRTSQTPVDPSSISTRYDCRGRLPVSAVNLARASGVELYRWSNRVWTSARAPGAGCTAGVEAHRIDVVPATFSADPGRLEHLVRAGLLS